MSYSLKLIDDNTLCLCDGNGSVIVQCEPLWTRFKQFKRIKENCNIIKEDNGDFPKNDKGTANIYCLDDNFKLKWTITAPFTDDSFPNQMMWNKKTVRRQGANGHLMLEVEESLSSFICSSWHGFTVTVDYETGETLSKEVTK